VKRVTGNERKERVTKNTTVELSSGDELGDRQEVLREYLSYIYVSWAISSRHSQVQAKTRPGERFLSKLGEGRNYSTCDP
jgi:hypothetical protein